MVRNKETTIVTIAMFLALIWGDRGRRRKGKQRNDKMQVARNMLRDERAIVRVHLPTYKGLKPISPPRLYTFA